MTIYLDNNATTKPLPEVITAMNEMLLDQWGNPSSVHRFGQMARQKVELARQQVAQLIGSSDKELIFTSGGTESNQLAIHGLLGNPRFERYKKHLVTSPLEHAAIREPTQRLQEHASCHVHHLTPDQQSQGLIVHDSLQSVLEDILQNASQPNQARLLILISLQWANNETGVIQPMAKYAAVIRQFRETLSQKSPDSVLIWHSDATQAAGKLPINVQNITNTESEPYPIDLLTMAAHKIHGPKGAGVLHARQGVPIFAQLLGGPQERERRGGTENTPAIIGMGVAAESAYQFLESNQPDLIAKRRDKLEMGVLEKISHTHINGNRVARLYNTTNIAFAHLEAEAILLSLSERGVYASAGAACSSGSLEPSPILLAMGIPEHLAHGSIRFSLCRDTTESEIDRTLKILPNLIAKLQKTLPM